MSVVVSDKIEEFLKNENYGEINFLGRTADEIYYRCKLHKGVVRHHLKIVENKSGKYKVYIGTNLEDSIYKGKYSFYKDIV